MFKSKKRRSSKRKPVTSAAKDSKPKKKRIIPITDEIEEKSYKMIAILGYVLIGLILFEYINFLVPPRFFNPTWELNTIGKIIDTIWILLLGLVMVLFRTHKSKVKQGELRLLSLLSWGALLMAFVCFLSAPLTASNALRLDRSNQTQINSQIATYNDGAENILGRAENATDAQLQQFLQQNNLFDGENTTDSVKAQFNNVIEQRKQDSVSQLNERLKSSRLSLAKKTFKYFIGAIVSGIAFVAIWKQSQWTRTVRL